MATNSSFGALFEPQAMTSVPNQERLQQPGAFSGALFEVMHQVNEGVQDLELYEFRYLLENYFPNEEGWEKVQLETPEAVEARIGSRSFYESIQLKPRRAEKIVLDEKLAGLTRMLLVGLATGVYTPEWVLAHFYFDLRGFFFLARTLYFSAAVKAHLGGKPYRAFEQRQRRFERFQALGYKDFRQANVEVDACFVECILKLAAERGTPLLLAIAGPTAAGKTEIVERLVNAFEARTMRVTNIEMDNFLFEREAREDKPMGKESMHFELFQKALAELALGKKTSIPRYDFINATSSHDMQGCLKPGCTPLEIEPADIFFIEGNFPFHLKEISELIKLKVVYLTDDPVRLKRKWKRDIDYRKKYDPTYFRNRYFRTQFLRAEDLYLPLMQVCEMVVDTSGAAIWATPEIAASLDGQESAGSLPRRQPDCYRRNTQ